MIVADSGAIYALYDADDTHHAAVISVFSSERDTFHIPSPCLAEIDILLRTRLGVSAELDFLEALATHRFILEPLTEPDIRRCATLLERYGNLEIGLSDASVVATAERLGTRRVLTVDHRHFQEIRTAAGSSLELFIRS